MAWIVLAHGQAAETDEEHGGALVVELAPQETSVATSDANLPLGPQSVEVPESVAQSAQDVPPPEPEAAETPPLPIVEPTEEAERMQEVEKPPVGKQPETIALPTSSPTATESSQASQAAAPQAIDAPVAERSAAPVAGSTQRATRAQLTWYKAISIHLNRHKRFPAAQASGGEAVVTFTLDRTGRVLSATLLRSTGSQALDAEAVALLQRASPVPRPSSEVIGETFVLTLPIVFRKP